MFNDLFYRRREPVFVAFDVLSIGGDDLRCRPLSERKQELRRILKPRPIRSLACSHVECAGKALFEAACELDLEGIVAKYRVRTVHLRARGNDVVQNTEPELLAVGRQERDVRPTA